MKINFIKIFTLIALSIHPELSAQDYLQKTYNINDGLVQSWVSALYQDSVGYIWIGTEHGLSRFDGTDFRNYTSPQNVFNDIIVKIFQDNENNLILVKPNNEMWEFDGIKFLPFNLPKDLENKAINDITRIGDSLFISTQKSGLYIIAGNDIENLTLNDGLLSDTINKVSKDRNNNIFIFTGKGVNQLKGKRISTFLKNADGLYSNALQNRKGNYFYTIDGYGFARIKKGKTEFFPLFKTVQCYQMLEAEDGVIWLSTSGGLISIVDDSNGQVIYTQHITAMSISGLLLDNENNIWTGTRGNGLQKVTRNLFTNFSINEGFPSFFGRVLLKDSRNNIWASAVEIACLRFDGNFNYYYYEKSEIPGKRISAATEDKLGNVLLAADNKISIFKNNRFEIYKPSLQLPEGRKYLIYYDSQDLLWASVVDGGLFFLQNDKWTKFSAIPDSCAEKINVIFEDRNSNLWFGSQRRGLYTFSRGQTFHIEKNDADYIYAIADDEGGNIWVGSDNGIYVYNNLRHVKYFSTEDGLPSNKIYALSRYQDKMLIGTADGFGIYDQNRFKFFNTADGLKSNDISSKTFLTDNHDYIWMGTTAGLSLFNINAFIQESKTYNVILSSIITEDDTLTYNQLKFTTPATLVFKPGTDLIKFNFSAIDFGNNPIEYRYKIQAEDKKSDWQISENSSIILTELSHGNYKLFISVKAFGDTWHDLPEYSFSIRPHFYQTSTFIILFLALTIISLVVGFIQRQKMNVKYRTSSLSADRSKVIKESLVKIMENEKLFTDPSLTLQKLSAKLGYTKEHISQVINSEFKLNFNDYVNTYRISKATELLLEKPDEHIIQIAYEVGFNNKASFNNAFKKIVSQTPTQFRKSFRK